MVSIVFVYARWGTNEVLAYVDGQLVSASDMSWLVSPAEVRLVNSAPLSSLDPTRRRARLALCSCVLLRRIRRFRCAQCTMHNAR